MDNKKINIGEVINKADELIERHLDGLDEIFKLDQVKTIASNNDMNLIGLQGAVAIKLNDVDDRVVFNETEVFELIEKVREISENHDNQMFHTCTMAIKVLSELMTQMAVVTEGKRKQKQGE